jgi:hypothetical protein
MEWKGGRGTYTVGGNSNSRRSTVIAPVGKTGGAVMGCAVASAALERRKFAGKSFIMKNQVQFFSSNTTLSLERQNWIWKRRHPSSIMDDNSYRIWKKRSGYFGMFAIQEMF